MLTGLPVPESLILASAIIALFTFVGNYLSDASFSTGHSTISYRNFLNLNRESFRNDTAQQDWFCNGSEDPNVLWNPVRSSLTEFSKRLAKMEMVCDKFNFKNHTDSCMVQEELQSLQ